MGAFVQRDDLYFYDPNAVDTMAEATEIVDFCIRHQMSRAGAIHFVRSRIERIRADQAERMNKIAGLHPDTPEAA